jgi:hypothetical protein
MTDVKEVWSGYAWDGTLTPIVVLWDTYNGSGFFYLKELDTNDLRDDLEDEHDIIAAYQNFYDDVDDFKHGVFFDLQSVLKRWRKEHG